MAVKVLLIEDNKPLSEILKNSLEEEGYEVETAFTAEEGLEKAESFLPDVAVVDVKLPHRDGISIMNELVYRTFYPLPIIVVSVIKSEAVVHDAFLFGAFSFLKKPFSVEELIKEIERAVKDVKERKYKRILIIEDDLALAEILKDELGKEENWKVEIAENLKKGKDLISPVLDLIILDMRFPKGEGTEIIKFLQSKPRWIPVIIFTAYKEEFFPKVKDVEGVYFMEKDGKVEDLKEKIKEIFEGGQR
ncbi:MAG: hypothetical protein DRI36_00125 [Caldiserica bacterium]|nr:MAG: hypothetical protein DRI36_00125 [Caldisericota bacterium]